MGYLNRKHQFFSQAFFILFYGIMDMCAFVIFSYQNLR